MTGAFAVFLVFVIPLAAQETQYLPHIADGQFASGSIRTTFIFFNTGIQRADVKLDLTRDDGSAFDAMLSELGPGSEFTFTLEAGGTLVVQTAGSDPIRSGAARVTSSTPIGASAIFSIYDPGGRFLTEAGVGSSPPLADFVVPVDTTGSFDTGLALFNINSGAVNATLRLFDQSGLVQGTTIQNLAAGAKTARFVSEFFPGLRGFRGTLRVSSALPLAGLALRQNSQPLSYTSLPAVSSTSSQTDFTLPQVADGQISGGSMRTTLLLFNISSRPSNVTVSFTRDDGTPLAVTLRDSGLNSTFELRLSPGAASFLQTEGTGALTAGAAHVTADEPIGVAAIFTVLDAPGRFQTEAGVGASAPMRDASIPVEESGTYGTGVAFFNPGEAPLVVSLALIDDSGEPVGATVRQTIAARGHLARFVGEWFPGTSDFRGSLGISASAPVAALTLRQNTTPLSFTTLPVAGGAIAPLQGDGTLLNEVLFNPAAGAAQFVELKLPPDVPRRAAGFVLENERGQQYRLPDTPAPLPAGGLLLILFDGRNFVEGATVHADRAGFLNSASGSVRLLNPAGGLLDLIDWGPDQPWGVALGRGGVIFEPDSGMTLVRIPSSVTPFERSDWLSAPSEQATPGVANPAPGVSVLVPFHGAVSAESQVTLSWYPVPGALRYRVQVAGDQNFAAPVLDRTVEAPPVIAGPLAPADYFWRVQAIGPGGAASDFSPAPLLTIIPAQSGAPKGAHAIEVTPKVPLLSQHKDTAMIHLESSRATGAHAWDVAHPGLEEIDRADNGNCALAAVAMIAQYYGGRLSQDRIGYEMFKDRVEGPERDLNYGEGLSDEDTARALSFALDAPARPFKVNYEIPGSAETFWNTVKTEIDEGRPLIGLLYWIVSKSGHAVVIRGYTTDAAGARYFLVNDPYFGPGNPQVFQYSLQPPFDPFSPGKWKGFIAVPLSGINARSDETGIALDSDRDGVVDFDEVNRFHTDPQNRDTDQDEITDKNDIRYSVFHVRHGYAYTWRKCKTGPCRIAMEKNPDSDAGGCYDGFEDNNHDGSQQAFETSNFSRWDDRCHLKGVEIRNENWQLTTPSSVINWQSKVDARFCLGPLLPAQRTTPNAPAGRAKVTWSARHTLRYTQFAGCGPFTITNSYSKTFSPEENSGSIALLDRDSVSLAFFPRPTSVEVTADYTEDPKCDANNPDVASVWPASSTIWAGVGFNWLPWDRRLTVSPGSNFNQTLTYPVSNGSGKSTLWIWFPPNQGQVSQPCTIP